MTDKAEFHTEFHWHRSFHAQDLIEHNSVSLQAGGLLTRLIHLMFSVKGPIKNDITWITRRAGVRDKRTVIKALDELIAADIIRVTDAGLVHDRSILEIKNKSAQQSENASKRSDNQKAVPEQSANSSPSDADLIAIKPRTGGSQVIEKQQNRDKPFKEQNQSQSQTAPLPPEADPAKPMNGHVSGGGSAVQDVIREFDILLVAFWGEQDKRSRPVDSDPEFAGQWLSQAGGSVKVVSQAIEAVMKVEKSGNRSAPGSLKYYRNSVRDKIAGLTAPVTLTAMSSGRSAGQAKVGGKTLWLKVFEQALENGHNDIANHLMALAGDEAPGEVEAANDYAESVREHVSRKKERAAA